VAAFSLLSAPASKVSWSGAHLASDDRHPHRLATALEVLMRRLASVRLVSCSVVFGLSLALCAAAPPATKLDAPVNAAFRNVHLHVDPSIVLEIRHIDGALLSTVPDQPPVFDDQRSFTLRIDSGVVAMSPEGLSDLLNHYVFAYDGAPLKNLKISIVNGQLHQEGTLHKGVNVPFAIDADISATPDGRIRLHPTKVKAAGLPTGGLMKLFGIELDELIKLKQTPGVQIQDNDFLLAPDRLLPAPKIAGHLTRVLIDGNRIVETFGTGTVAKITPPDPRARNFMYYRGGTLRFGKLTMSDADMQLIDANPRNPFEFFPERYIVQLVAGYSKNTLSGGLKVYMPDYTDAARTQPRTQRTR
jgi:hypothetical protein